MPRHCPEDYVLLDGIASFVILSLPRMIKKLEVKNFKSIKDLKIDCKRINVFIGKPNTGKSNILESVGIFSTPYDRLNGFVRFESMINIFYDQNLAESVHIKADESLCDIRFDRGEFVISMSGGEGDNSFKLDLRYGYTNGGSGSYSGRPNIKFYKFETMEKFPRMEADFLLPPNGKNLLSILSTHKNLQKLAADVFSEFKLRVVLKPHESKIDVQKETGDIAIAHPYSLVSDTLQRIVFYLVAVQTNKDSVIIFEEPEAHAFPYYTKFLAETIALDTSNQYFLSTHNPYFLFAILEKASKDDIGVFLTYFEDYQTKVKALTDKQMQEMLSLEASVFFNLDKFLSPE